MELTIPADRMAASRARRSLHPFRGGLPASVYEDLKLLTSELVTNCVRHAGLDPKDVIGLSARSRPGVLRVEVTDGGGGFQPGSPRPTGAGGWGLFLVDRIADRWGVQGTNGTIVWFEIDL